VTVDLGEGTATLSVTDLPVGDYGTVGNALTGGHAEFAHVSFDAQWSNPKERVKIRSGETGFAGTFVRNTANLHWSAAESGFSFVSDPLDSKFAEIGRERNGSFFSGGGDDGEDDENGDEND
jgi:hypothetical protein